MCLEDGGAGKTLVAAFLRVPFLPLSLCEASVPWRKGPATRGHPQGPSLCSWRFALPLLGAEMQGCGRAWWSRGGLQCWPLGAV